jgi:hypothetical protein
MAWNDVARKLREELLGNSTISTAVGNRVHYQILPEGSVYPHIWFTREGTSQEDSLDGDSGLTTVDFTFEVISDTNAEALVDAIVDALKPIEGDITGGEYISLVDLTDADDGYLFKSAGDDIPAFMHALRVTVFL